MKTYIIAYVNNFENIMMFHTIKANSEEEALLEFTADHMEMEDLAKEWEDEGMDTDSILEEYFNMEHIVGVHLHE